MQCRHCGTALKHIFIDLYNSPPSNSYLTMEQLNEPEILFPLKIWVCHSCFLVQIDEYKKSEDIFTSDYAYFSSYSTSWLLHAQQYVEMITKKLHLDENSHVMEIASNDGYLLQYFAAKKIPCLGIEPTASTATVAKNKGITVLEAFFGAKLAQSLKKADLIVGNNVLAHVPDINDFVEGLKIALKSNGVITMEFPHILNLIRLNQFDTIYHEHFCYFSLLAVQSIFTSKDLKIYDIEELPTHGGSLRIYAIHRENDIEVRHSVSEMLEKERAADLDTLAGYAGFESGVQRVKMDFLEFLLAAKREGKKVVGYGAAAKGNTLLNYCGVKSDLIDFVADASPYKQSKFMPLSHIPIVSESQIKETRPEYVLILPWNLKEEIMEQLQYVLSWNAQFVTAIPWLEKWY